MPVSDRVSRDEIVALASRLIAVPSTSGEERAIMEDVARWCDEVGLQYQTIASDPDRPNVIVTVGDPTSGPTIVMNGHLDTVPVSDPVAWKSGPYDPTVSDDGRKLIGRGASDMKSSVAVMLYVAQLLKDAPLNGCVQVHVVSDEETNGKFGTLFVLDEIAAGRLPRPDYCLIGEKSDLKVRNAERGLLAIDVTVLGRASHTAAARVTGVNAIAKAAKAIVALDTDIDRFHPAVGKPVISINTIQAGVAHNVVPGECTFSIDRRLIPGETRDSAVAEIVAKLDAIAADDPNFRYELTIDPQRNHIPANITDEDSPLVQAVQASIRAVTGQEPEYFVAWAGATDGRFYRQAGIDTVGYGPGGENAHGANEAVNIDDLITQARVYVETVQRVMGDGL
ncbi:MAG: putative peptidic bond hydrolase [Thermomicrobiales bacterium]|nr:putative peptidic bond hydrolase [Thermomicrobiales bacterium]